LELTADVESTTTPSTTPTTRVEQSTTRPTTPPPPYAPDIYPGVFFTGTLHFEGANEEEE